MPTCSKSRPGVLWVCSVFVQLQLPPSVSGQVLAMLRVDSLHLPIYTVRTDAGADEKLGKTIQCWLQGIPVHVKLVVCVLAGSPGVCVSSVVTDELLSVDEGQKV